MRKSFKKAMSSILAVSMLCSSAVFAPTSAFAAGFSSVGGWNESIYAEISGISDADVTGVSYSGTMSGSLTGDDLTYLVRDEGNGVRIDIPGLKAGTYDLTVTTSSGTVSQSGITVENYDRSGYAHFNYTEGVGAYNDDGTLKDNAIVLYVTEDTKNTVTLSYGGKTVSGIGNILNSAGAKPKTNEKGNVLSEVINTNQEILKDLGTNNIPLVVRIVGEVKGGDSNTSNNPPATPIDGLTAYDSYDYGGTDNDNGMMARIQNAKDITIEGIGDDAAIIGWGIHFMSGTAAYNAGLGKSCEVRNIHFEEYPEDAFGAEGVQSGTTLSAPVERIWVHNNSFGPGFCKVPAESDKAEGDGSCDFKRGNYYTMSYNKYWDCHKTNLIGSSDASLQYYMSLHHNYYNNCMARGPLSRQGNVHMYNNVYVGQTDYAVNPRAKSYIFTEYNIFEECKNPVETASGGVCMSLNDTFFACSGNMQATTVTDKSKNITNTCAVSDFVTNPNESYIPNDNYLLQTDVKDIKAYTLANAGVMNYTSPEDVDTSIITNKPTSYVELPYEASINSTYLGTATGVQKKDNIIFNPSKKPAADSITIRNEGIVFYVAQEVTVTMTAVSATAEPQLSSEYGEVYLTGSGTVVIPAGTYMIQSNIYDPGSSAYKESKVSYLSIKANDGTIVTGTTVTEGTTESTSAVDPENTTEEVTDDDTEPTTNDTGNRNDPVKMGTYVIGSSASGGDYNITEKLGVSTGNMEYDLRSISTDGGRLRGQNNSLSFNLTQNADITVTFANRGIEIYNINTGASITADDSESPYTTSLTPGYYSIFGGDSGSNTAISQIVLTATGDDPVDNTTVATTEATTEATTAATTEATTEAATEGTTSAEGVNLSVGSASAKVGETITVPVKITGISAIDNYQLSVSYNKAVLTATEVSNGDVVDSTDALFDSNIDTANGIVNVALSNVDPINTEGTVLFNITFTANATGSADITLNVDEFRGNEADIEFTVSKGAVTVTDSSSTSTPGDVNKDGKVNAVDAAIVLRITSGITTDTSAYDMDAADCDGKTGVTVLDAIWILNHQDTSSDDTTTETTTSAVATTEATTEATTADTTTEATTEAPVTGDYVAAGTYNFGQSTISELSGTYNNMSYSVSQIDASQVRIDNTGYVKFKVAEPMSLKVTLTSNNLVINGGAYTDQLINRNDESTQTVALEKDVEYTISGATSSKARLTSLVFSKSGSGQIEDTTKATTEATTEATTKATTEATTKATTQATTKADTTTEATTQAPVSGGLAAGTYTLNKVNAVTNTIEGLDTSAIYGSDSGAIKVRSASYVTIVPAVSGTISITWSSNAPKAVLVSGSTETDIATATASPFTFNVTAGQTYKVYGTKSGGNSNLTELVLTNGSGETPVEPTTSSGSDGNTESTTVDLNGAVNIAAGDAASLESAVKNATAGQVINLAAGNYTMSSSVLTCSKTASASNPITITCSDGYATLDFDKQSVSDSNFGFKVSGSYYNFSNLVVKNAGDNGMYITGSHINVENCVFQANNDTGLQISSGGNNVLIKNCTAFDNLDPGTRENADGFAAKLGVGQNVVFDGCISYCNSDDGWDLYSKSGSQQNKYPITLRNCIAFNNGNTTSGSGSANGDMNGFKLGGEGYPAAHVVENCIAFGNGTCGFTDNDNPGLATIKNCTGYMNAQINVKKHNFSVFRATEGIALTNCLSYVLNTDPNGGMDRFYGSSENVYTGSNATITNSIFGENDKYYKITGPTTKSFTALGQISTIGTETTVDDSMFESLTLPYTDLQKVHEQMRNADGSIKLNGFLQPKAGSAIEGLGAVFN